MGSSPFRATRRGALLGAAALAGVHATGGRALAQATPEPTSWGSAAPLRNGGRSEFAATTLDGKIYIAGGFGAESLFDRYDPATDTWEVLADLPEPRHHLAVVAFDGGVYITGGHNQEANSATDTFWRYDVAAGSWSTLEPLPQGPRGALGAAVVEDSIYVVGGSSGDLSGPATADVSRYHIPSATWEMRSPMPIAREHLAVSDAGVKIVAAGGRDGSHEAHNLLAATEIYNPVDDAWSVGTDLPVPRAGFGVASTGGVVIVLGGERFTDDSGNSDVETYAAVDAYQVDGDRWTELPDLPQARHGMAAAIVDGVLYAIGGSTLAGQVQNVDRVDTLRLG